MNRPVAHSRQGITWFFVSSREPDTEPITLRLQKEGRGGEGVMLDGVWDEGEGFCLYQDSNQQPLISEPNVLTAWLHAPPPSIYGLKTVFDPLWRQRFKDNGDAFSTLLESHFSVSYNRSDCHLHSDKTPKQPPETESTASVLNLFFFLSTHKTLKTMLSNSTIQDKLQIFKQCVFFIIVWFCNVHSLTKRTLLENVNIVLSN